MVTELAGGGEEMWQILVHESEIRIPVPAYRSAVSDAAEQQAHDHPVPARKARFGQDVVEFDQAVLAPLFKRPPTQLVHELIQFAHGGKYSWLYFER